MGPLSTSNKVVDDKARKLALDPEQSFIIQAPAGSGKTELLTQRFLALLSRVTKPEEILAITFTRKAASEMRSRIISSLEIARIQTKQPEKEPDSTTWTLAKQVLKQNALYQWDLLENSQRLQVQTIDSFCAGLTRRLPYLSGLGSEANTTVQSARLYQEAARQTIALINSEEKSWTSPIETLLLHLDGDQKRAEKLLSQMLARRDQWLPCLSHDQADFIQFRKYLEFSLQQLLSERLTEISNQLTTEVIEELQILSSYALKNIRQTGISSTLFDNFNGDLTENLDIETYTQWQIISRWVLTADGKNIRKTMNKNHGFPAASSGKDSLQKAYFNNMKKRMVALLDDLAPILSIFAELKQLPPYKYNDKQWYLLEALMSCLTLATGLLKVIFSHSGEMDFQEVSLRATHALGEDEQPTNLTLALDYQLNHILIDEFQDTSHSQFELLSKLLRGWQKDDGRSLFLVGDPMQSIYRFREADVGLFLKVRQEGIAGIHPKPLHLKVNFRSTNNIVDWVNRYFCTIMPQREDIIHGAVSYADSIASKTSDDGGIKIYPHFNNDGRTEANQLAEIIQQHTQTNPNLSLAVLVKSRSQLATLMPVFQNKGLKFTATEIEQLGNRQVITDLQMLSRALVDPSDRIAWLALLRAPWCGMLLQDLLVISAIKSSSILHNCQSQQLLQQLSKDGASRLAVIIEKIKPWLLINSRNNIRQNVEGCWLAIDGPAYIENKIDLQAAELYLDLLSSMQQGGVIKDPQALLQQLSELYSPAATDANANLQMMTIHKSKGLEFDTVILPALNAGARHDDHTLLRWMKVSFNNSEGLLMAPIHAHIKEPDPLYDYLSGVAKKQRYYESGRLLYVACTRAKRRLILSATVMTKPDIKADELKPKKGSQLDELWSALADNFKTAFSSIVRSEQMEIEVECKNDYRLKRTVNYQYFASDTLFNDTLPLDIPSSPAQEKPILYAASAMKRHVGTLTHNWLEQIADNLDKWSPDRIQQKQAIFTSQLKQLGVAGTDLIKATELVTHNLQQTLSDEQAIFLLSKHKQSVSELALEIEEDGIFKNYIIDRSFIDDKGTRWIIDYKTSTHQGSGRQDFLLQQKHYYTDQLENYASLFVELESHPIKLALYFTAYQKLISWDYQRGCQ